MGWTILVIILFLGALVWVGWYGKKLVKTSVDFLLAGRNLSLGINMMAVVAAGFAGTTISLAPALALNFGFFGTFMFAFAYSIVGIVLYGLFFAKVIRRSGAHTLPEWLEIRFSKRVRRVLSLLGLVGLIAVTSNNVLALANVISGYFKISLYISIAIGVVTFMLFTYFSGMWGVSLTDFVQALLGCVGAPLLIILLLHQFGGFEVPTTGWPSGDWWGKGIAGNQLKVLGLTYPSVLTMILNLGIFLVWGGQHYWIRMASARNEKQAQQSFSIAGIILFMITALIGVVGLYAGGVFSSDFVNLGGTVRPDSAYGFVISKFPAAAGSFLLLFALAASLSTAASTLMAAVSTGVRDVYKQFINKQANDQQTIRASRLITVLISLIAWGLAYYPGGTTFLFAFATAWWAPAGLLFALGMISNRITKSGAWLGTVVGTVCLTLWAILDIFKVPLIAGKPIGSFVHMSVVGLITVILPTIIGSYFTKPKYYGDREWIEGKKFSSIVLNDHDRIILKHIQNGFKRNAQLMDITGWPGEVLNETIERLDESGYIQRDSLKGLGFWKFSLTKKGTSAIPPIEAKNHSLQQYDLVDQDMVYLKTLENLGKVNMTDHIYKIASDANAQKDAMASFMKLINNGFVDESGFIRRYMAISASGSQLLK